MAKNYTNYSSTYRESDAVRQAQALLQQQLSQKPGAYQSEWQTQLNDTINKILNREKFSYDLNGDALYQQYKDQYTTQGKMAMMDTMGQAAAMTGGYGNSYAATVGNQAYQGYLQGLNDKVPELYQLAMQRYNMEGDQLKAAYDVLKGEDETAYGRFMDNKSALFNEMQYYNNLYDSAYTQAQTNYNNTLNSNNDNYWNEYNTGYQAERDSISDKQWQDTFNYNKTQDEIANELARSQLKLQQDEFDWQKSQPKSVSSGGNSTGKTIESSLPSGIIDKVGSLGNDIERANYVADQAAKGYITEDQKNYILTQTLAGDTVEYSGGRYYMVDDGGVNGFLGLGKWLGNIDNNAKVMDENGNTYTMEQLYNKKIKEGMTEKEAKEFVVGLQKAVGAH